MFPRAVPHGTHLSETAETQITNTLFRADKQTGQTVFYFKPPSLYCAFMLVVFRFCFWIMNLSRTQLLIYLFAFFSLSSYPVLSIFSINLIQHMMFLVKGRKCSVG